MERPARRGRRARAPTTPARSATYFAAATQAALVLAAFRAPYRGRSTPVNAWWGSFDLAVNLFSGLPADPPSDDFIMRNAMDAQEVAVGWWPGDPRYGKAAFYAYAHPAPEGFADAKLSPAPARWDASPRRVRPRLGRRHRRRRPARLRARVRPLGLPPRLPGVRLEPRARGQRRGHAAAAGLSDILEPREPSDAAQPPASADRNDTLSPATSGCVWVARDPVAVEGRHDVPVEAQPAGSRGLAERCGGQERGIAVHRAVAAQRPEDPDRDLGRRAGARRLVVGRLVEVEQRSRAAGRAPPAPDRPAAPRRRGGARGTPRRGRPGASGPRRSGARRRRPAPSCRPRPADGGSRRRRAAPRRRRRRGPRARGG